MAFLSRHAFLCGGVVNPNIFREEMRSQQAMPRYADIQKGKKAEAGHVSAACVQ